MIEKYIAVVGCGDWGKNLVRSFSKLGALGAICDDNSVIQQEMSRLYKVPHLTFKEILENPSLSSVVIASPAIHHAAQVKNALSADKNVFVEKPMALQLSDAKDMCKLAKDKNKILMVGHLLRYHPAYVKLKEMVNYNELGKVQYIYSNRLSCGKIRTQENVFWSFAPHDISMVLGLANSKVVDVKANSSSFISDNVEDIIIAHLKFKNKIRAHIFVSWLHPYKEQKLVVIGDKGMAVFDDGKNWEEKLQFYPHKVTIDNHIPIINKAAAVSIKVQESEPLMLESQHFFDSTQNMTQPLTNGQEGYRVLEVLQVVQHALYVSKNNN